MLWQILDEISSAVLTVPRREALDATRRLCVPWFNAD